MSLVGHLLLLLSPSHTGQNAGCDRRRFIHRKWKRSYTVIWILKDQLTNAGSK